MTQVISIMFCRCAFRRTLSNSPVALHFNHTQNCKLLPNLVPTQTQVCRSHPESVKIIVQAAREVKKTCQKTFADMRWNCSSIEVPNENPKYRPDLDRGTTCNYLQSRWFETGRRLL